MRTSIVVAGLGCLCGFTGCEVSPHELEEAKSQPGVSTGATAKQEPVLMDVLPAEVRDTLNRRTRWQGGAATDNNIDLLVGCTITRQKDDPSKYDAESLSPVSFGGKMPTIKLLEKPPMFANKIAVGKEATLGVLFLQAELKDVLVVDVCVRDAAQIIVPRENIPWEHLKRIHSTPKEFPEQKRAYIYAVTLTTVSAYTLRDEAHKGTIVGDVFGIGGKLYRRNEASLHKVLVWIDAFDIDKAVPQYQAVLDSIQQPGPENRQASTNEERAQTAARMILVNALPKLSVPAVTISFGNDHN